MIRIELGRLGKGPIGRLPIAFVLLDHPQPVITIGKFGIDLEGIFKLQLGFDIVALFVECFAFFEELHLFFFLTAAGGHGSQ